MFWAVKKGVAPSALVGSRVPLTISCNDHLRTPHEHPDEHRQTPIGTPPEVWIPPKRRGSLRNLRENSILSLHVLLQAGIVKWQKGAVTHEFTLQESWQDSGQGSMLVLLVRTGA